MSKFIPQIAGYYLDIVDINDTFSASIIKHEYPYSNRNKLQNNGQKTPGFTVNCRFMADPAITKGWDSGVAIFPTYDAYFNFKATLESATEKYTFTHPELGELEGFVENFTSVEDDTIDYFEVSFDFFQEVTDDTPTFFRYVVPSQADGFRETNANTFSKIAALEKAAVSAVAFAGRANAFKGTLDSYLSQVTNPLTSITNTITYTADIPGQLMQSINKAIDRVIESFVEIRDTPASFINNCILGVRQLASQFSDEEFQYTLIMGASRVSYEAATIYQEDDVKKQKVDKKEAVETFDAAGNYVGGDPIPVTMTVQELEQSLYDVRELINDVILLDRLNQDLKKQANELQKYINEIKLTRETLETQEIPEQSIHTIALINNQSYQAAERILKLNPHIKNPNFSSGAIKVPVPQQA